MLLAFDWTLERIAAALSITPPTLRKNYFRQLKVREEARARVEARLLNCLMAEAQAGNVSAIDKYLKRLDKHDLEDLAERRANRAGPEPERKPGKKEQQLIDAGNVVGRYAPPAAPGTVN